MTAKPSPDKYIDVAELIQAFYAKYPEGSLTRAGDPYLVEIEGQRWWRRCSPRAYLVYTAKAHRRPDDPVPAMGTAWEPVPGRTPGTREFELMHAETAAWGRAIIAAGVGAKRGSAIAPGQKVATRISDGAAAPNAKKKMSLQQVATVHERLFKKSLSDDDIDRQLAAFGVEGIDQLTPAQAKDLLASVDA